MTRIRFPHNSLPWQKEADVVIVGFGGAGAVSAITAHDAGANVLILEKMPRGKEGGNTLVSAGIVFSPVDVEAATEYFRALSCGGFLYQGAGNLGECLAFGRIAGKKAAGEKPYREL